MKIIAIIGAGPIGHYIAIKLFPIIPPGGKLVIIDRRLGEFRRKGIIAANVVDVFRRNDIEIRVDKCTTNGILICNLEQELNNHLELVRQKYPTVEFVPMRATATHFAADGKGITVVLNSDVQQDINCDLAIDCTGTRRKLVTLLTSANISPISDNPVKMHCMACIEATCEARQLMMSKEVEELLQLPPTELFQKLKKDGEKSIVYRHVVQLEMMRRDYQWPKLCIPECIVSEANASSTSGKNQFYLYFELPEALVHDPSRQIAWLKALLTLRTGQPAIEFTVPDDSFIPFPLEFTMVAEAVFQAETHHPTVVPCGDAQMAPDYRGGFGIESGINRANCLICCIKADLTIDKDRYQSSLLEPIENHKRRVVEYCEARKKTICNGQAFEAQCYNVVMNAGTHLPSFPRPELLSETFNILIEEMKKSGDAYLKKDNFEKAESCYLQVLSYAQQDLDPLVVTMQSNLLVALRRLEKHQEAVNLGTKLVDCIKRGCQVELKVIEKIYNLTGDSILKLAKLMLDKGDRAGGCRLLEQYTELSQKVTSLPITEEFKRINDMFFREDKCVADTQAARAVVGAMHPSTDRSTSSMSKEDASPPKNQSDNTC